MGLDSHGGTPESVSMVHRFVRFGKFAKIAVSGSVR